MIPLLSFDKGPGRWARASEIVLDPEFSRLLPQPSADELARMDAALFLEGCRQPLVVWPFAKALILLVGYDLFPLLRRRGIPFRVVEHRPASRDHARLFIVTHRLRQPNLGPLGVSYLGGLCYCGEKRPHGGDRKSAPAQWGKGKTAGALGENFSVSPATIERDAKVVAAVHGIAATCGGDEVKSWLLCQDTRMSRQALMDLSQLPADMQRAVVGAWRVLHKQPKGWRNDGKPKFITVPVEAKRLAEAVLRRLGDDPAAEVYEELGRLLDRVAAAEAAGTRTP